MVPANSRPEKDAAWAFNACPGLSVPKRSSGTENSTSTPERSSRTATTSPALTRDPVSISEKLMKPENGARKNRSLRRLLALSNCARAIFACAFRLSRVACDMLLDCLRLSERCKAREASSRRALASTTSASSITESRASRRDRALTSVVCDNRDSTTRPAESGAISTERTARVVPTASTTRSIRCIDAAEASTLIGFRTALGLAFDDALSVASSGQE